MTQYVDSHAHLTSREFDDDRDEVIRRALEHGVEFIVNPATNLDDSRKAVELAEKHEGVYACVGIHPHEASSASDVAFAEIEELSKHPKVVAIGEIGLDYHYDFSPREVQRDVFQSQLLLAQRRDLPVVIHTRESLEDTLSIVTNVTEMHPRWRAGQAPEKARIPGPRGIFHCYPGDVATAWKLVAAGFFISFPGVITFKNPGLAAHVASEISIEHLLLETDSPYLAPVPLRGKRNEPANIPLIAQKLAQLQHLSVDDIARATGYSAFRLFGVGRAPQPRFTYTLRDSLYINLTIRCNADCVFCDRKGQAVVKGHNLRIEREPTAEEVIAEIGDPQRYEEIVFCGYGEPTIRLDALKHVAQWVKERGGKTRLNTDGHGNVINKRNIIPELSGIIDAVSISLNSTDPQEYGALMRVDGPRMFSAMVEFAREAVKTLPRVVMTIVDLQSVDEARARRFVEEEIGAIFSKRPYF